MFSPLDHVCWHSIDYCFASVDGRAGGLDSSYIPLAIIVTDFIGEPIDILMYK